MAPHLRLLGSPSCSFLSPIAQSGCSALLSTTYGSLPTSSHTPLLACTHRTGYSFPPTTVMAPYYLHGQAALLPHYRFRSNTFSLVSFGVEFSWDDWWWGIFSFQEKNVLLPSGVLCDPNGLNQTALKYSNVYISPLTWVTQPCSQ